MNLPFVTLAAALVVATSAGAQAPAPPPQVGPIYVVAYVEAKTSDIATAIRHLKTYRAAAAKEAGAVAIRIYEETSRPNRFLVDEVWSDFAAWETHAKTGALAEVIKSEQLAPPDVRAHMQWSVAPAPDLPAGGFYIYTHIDVTPPKLVALQDILTPYIAKSRKDKGAVRFDLLQAPSPRLNHQTLVEGWASETDFRAHQASSHAIEFRDKLGPLLGALYDQRFYKLLP